MMVGVLLAAGGSTRMGSSKPLRRERGVSYLVLGVRHLWTACTTVVAVLGADAARVRRTAEEEFQRLLESGALNPDLAVAHRHSAAGLELHFETHRAWKKGMLSSAQAGLEWALAHKPDGILVLPVDHPAVHAATVMQLASLMAEAVKSSRSPAERKRFAYALVPRYRGHRGHPVAMTPALARAVAADKKAEHLSDAIKRNARLVGYLDVDDPGVVRNVNRTTD